MSKEKKGTTICSLDDLTFPVKLIENPTKTNTEYSRIVVGDIDGKPTPKIMDMNGTIIKPEGWESGEDFHLNYCSPRYELVPNASIFPKVENILRVHGIAFTAKYSHTNHASFYGSYEITDPRFAYTMEGTNDKIRFIWNFQHSYNGLTKYKGVAGFYRLICSNGLTVPVKQMEEYNLVIQGKHTKSILDSLEKFSHILENVTNNFDEVSGAITGNYEKLSRVWVKNPEKRVEEVMKANKLAIVENNKFATMEHIMSTVMSEATTTGLGYNGKINDWLIYNGINQYINDNSRNIAAPEMRREKDSKVLEYMLKFAA